MSALLALAERLTLEALAGGPDEFAPSLRNWLQGEGAAAPLTRLAGGFALDDDEAAVLALLFAAASSESAARALDEAAPAAGGRGVPVWLVRRLLPELTLGAFAAGAPLRRFELVRIEDEAVRVEARLRLSEAVLDRLAGSVPVEPEVQARIMPAAARPALADAALVGSLADALRERREGLPPLLVCSDSEPEATAASLLALGLRPALVDSAAIPEEPLSRDRLARLWSRESALDGAALIVRSREGDGAILADFADRILGHVILCGPPPPVAPRRGLRLICEPPRTVARAAERWRSALGVERAARLGAGLLRIAGQFRLDPAEIDALCAGVGAEIDSAPSAAAATALLWRRAGRLPPAAPVPGVTLVEPRVGWEDLVLPPAVASALRRVEIHVRHATTVFDDWGFGGRMAGRGRGVAALFSGPSGTGKTMAAEVLASELDLRLMLVDLSQIISKYVGETSKNIAAAFRLAERTGAVMVWNEGDAIWGARGAVSTATDRHINAEIGDLLQRIEAFDGFTVVTTNLRHAIDPAFLRRFRFTIDFPMPTQAERLVLWRRAFPAGAPLAEINWGALAALPLSGGSIRNVALGSAFLAADRGGAIDNGLIEAELGEELRKHDLSVPAIDWEREP